MRRGKAEQSPVRLMQNGSTIGLSPSPGKATKSAGLSNDGLSTLQVSPPVSPARQNGHAMPSAFQSSAARPPADLKVHTCLVPR